MLDRDEAVDLLVESGMCKSEDEAMEVVGSNTVDHLSILIEQARNVLDDNFKSCWKCSYCEEDEVDGEAGFICTKHNVDISANDSTIKDDCTDYKSEATIKKSEEGCNENDRC